MGRMCITQSDTFRYTRLRYCLAFFGDGDGGRGWGHHSLDTTTPKGFYSKFANVTRATCASPAPAYMAHAQSAHWHEAKMRMYTSWA